MFANIHKVLGKFEYQDGGKVVKRELVGRRLNSCLRYEQTIGWFRMKKTDRLDFLGPKQISSVSNGWPSFEQLSQICEVGQ